MDSEQQEPTKPTQPENAAAALLGGSLADQMPEADLSTVSSQTQPVEPLKTAEKQQEPAANPAPSPAPTGSKPALVDAQGRTFNPLLHEVDANGQPELRKGTNLLKCRRTPLKGAATESRVELGPAPAAAAPADQPGAAPAAGQPAPVDPAKAAAMQEAGAATMAGLQIQMMKLALGEHTASTNEEREALVSAWRDTFAYYGMGAVHPLVGLGLVTGAVVMKAIHQPEGRSRWQRLTGAVKVKLYGAWLWFRGKKKPAEPEKEREPEGEREAA